MSITLKVSWNWAKDLLQFAYNFLHYNTMGTGKVVGLEREQQMKVKEQDNWEFCK